MTSRREDEENPWSSSDEEDDDDEECEVDDGDDDDIFYSICSYSHRNPSTAPKFDTLASALEHDTSTYGFDFLSFLASPKDEDDFFEGTIKLVNKCRQFVKDNEGGSAKTTELGNGLNAYLKNRCANDEADMAYYKPVLEDDALLMCIDEIQELKMKNEKGDASSSLDKVKEANVSSPDSETVKRLQSEIALLNDKLSHAKICIAKFANDDSSEDDDDDDKLNKKKKAPDNDSYYFNSYSNTSIHETMLRDTIRTAAYEEAILSNAESLFRGKTVLDIGCGTGVLSLFCAKAGARKVIGVDNSDIIHQAEEIVKLNGYEDVVILVRGKMETLIEKKGLPLSDGETVDIIVSEWMGYGLFFETMLPSVMVARDAIMTPGTGSMFPNVSKIYIEGGNDKERIQYWDSVHSLNMAPMKDRMVAELTKDALVEVVADGNIITDRVMVVEHDLNTCKDEELDFEAPFELRLRSEKPSNGDAGVEVHQLIVSFDIDFAVPNSKVVSFSTGCQSTPTHWKQTVLWFDPMHNCPVLKGGDVMRGKFRMKRNAENHRSIDMAVIWETGRMGEDGSWARSMDGVLRRSLIA